MTNIIFPRMSEKGFNQSKENVYTFNIPMYANKITVKKAVEEQFGVKVTNVNISLTKGKVITGIRKNGKRTKGARSNFKKAYVTVAKGDSIPVFAAAAGEEE